MPVSVTEAWPGAAYQGAVPAAVGRWRTRQHRAGRAGILVPRPSGARPPSDRYQAVQGNRPHSPVTKALLRGRFEGGRRGRFERRVGDLLDPLGPDEAELVARCLGNVLVILAVARRQDDRREPGAGGGDDLLLDAADRQHETAQADLAGH